MTVKKTDTKKIDDSKRGLNQKDSDFSKPSESRKIIRTRTK